MCTSFFFLCSYANVKLTARCFIQRCYILYSIYNIYSIYTCVCASTHLKAVVLSEDAGVHRFDDDLVLHAEVQDLHSRAGAEQRLVGARLLQPRHEMRSGDGGERRRRGREEIGRASCRERV